MDIEIRDIQSVLMKLLILRAVSHEFDLGKEFFGPFGSLGHVLSGAGANHVNLKMAPRG